MICCNKITINFAVFRNFLVLFYCSCGFVFSQSVDNLVSIELSQPTFPIERPFTISVIISKSDSRPTVSFPDIPGFSKRGTSASVTTTDVAGKMVTNQIITQNYQARAPGRFLLAPFEITINGEVVQSKGALLVVQPPTTASAPTNATQITVSNDAAFVSLRTSKSSIFAGEGIALTLSFFVADNYPYELSFKSLDQQLQNITKSIRPTNAWEENLAITELKPISILIKGKKYREIRLFQSIFFPLSSQPLRLPAVSIWLTQTRTPASQAEKVVFTSRPVTVAVRPLPSHPLRGRVPVGAFRLEESLERHRVGVGQSTRYTFAITGEGNIATLPAPTRLEETTSVDVFPPEERQQITRSTDGVTGRKTFAYFIVPRQNGILSLANQFQWIYFDPETARYDTLHPNLQLQVGGSLAVVNNTSASVNAADTDGDVASVSPIGNSLYQGIEALDSTHQPISIAVLVRSIANVVLVLMLLGMIFVFFKK
ncbi:BatD family protein [Spirosoma soli]|uniref:BatD family protein n=1 Tax=Spirosoma soli TaxID=1770529 RepID=A0ABW5MBC4_9BACT